MLLESLDLWNNTGVQNVNPLAGMPLKKLNCGATNISDLSPLKGMPLVDLRINRTDVTDLTALEGMKLETFVFSPGHITKGMQIIRDMKSIRKIGPNGLDLTDPDEFWEKYDTRKPK